MIRWIRELQRLTYVIPLPVEFVMVASDHGNLNRLPHLLTAAANSKVFWQTLGIQLSVNVRALHTPLKPEGSYFDELQRLHHWDLGARPPAIYVFSDEGNIETDLLGKAFGGGIAVAAGNVLQPGGGSLLDEIIDHELGHILGLDHEDGTFMRAQLEIVERNVTPIQKQKLRTNARAMF